MSIHDLLKRVDRSEWRLVAFVAIATVVITTLPYVLAALTAPTGTFYTGLHFLAPGDVPVYYSYIDAARHGQFVFTDLYTSEPHQPFNLNFFWVPVGWLARIAHLSAPVAFQLARVLTVPLFFLVLYPLLTTVFADRIKRKTAFLLVAFGSGIGGWFLPVFRSLFHGDFPLRWYPMDLWVSEAFPVLSAYQTGHFVFGTTLLMVTFAATLAAWKTNRYRYSLLAGAASLALFTFHPFHLLTIAAVLVAWGVVEVTRFRLPLGRAISHLLVVGAVAAPAAFGQYLLFKLNPIAAGRASQNILPTVQPLVAAVSYGFLLVGATWTLRRGQSRKQELTVLLGVWAVVQLAFIFAPVLFQRRLTQGLSIPLALLTTEAVVALRDAVRQRWKTLGPFLTGNRFVLAFLFLVTFGFSTLVVLAQDGMYLATVGRQYPVHFFLPVAYQDIFAALRRTPADSLTITSATIGNLIPGYTQRRVYIGHDVETLRYDKKYAEVRRLFADAESPAAQAVFLRSHGVTYLVWGAWERRLGTFDPRTKPFLEPVVTTEDVSLYHVR